MEAARAGAERLVDRHLPGPRPPVHHRQDHRHPEQACLGMLCPYRFENNFEDDD